MTVTISEFREQRGMSGYLERLLSLAGGVDEEFTGTEVSYRQLLTRTQPAHVIDRTDTPIQVLFLLELDTGRRDQLGALATAHGWSPPAPRPWDAFIRHHTQA